MTPAVEVELHVDGGVRLAGPVDRLCRPADVMRAGHAEPLAGRQLADPLAPAARLLHAVEALGEPVAVHHQVVGGAGRRVQQILAPHLERVEPEFARHAIDQHFEGVPHGDRAMPAHRSAGRQVRVDAIAVIFDRRDVVDAVQERARIEDGDDAVAGVGAAALGHFCFARRHAAVFLHAETDAHRSLRAGAVGDEILLARQLHHHLALGGAGEQRGDELEIERLHARAETAADERLDDPDLRLVHGEAARQHQMQVVRHLGDALHGEAAGEQIVFGERRMQLDLRVVDLRAVDIDLAHEIGFGEATRHVAERVVHLPFEIARLGVVDEDCARRKRGFRRVVGRQLPHLELDQIERALGGVRVDRRHRRNRLAAVAHLVARERIFVHRDRQHAIGVRAVRAGDDGDDAVKRARLRHVEPENLAMADRTAEDAADKRVGMVEIGRVARLAGDLLDAVDERNAPPQSLELRRNVVHRAASAAVCTDSTIFT